MPLNALSQTSVDIEPYQQKSSILPLPTPLLNLINSILSPLLIKKQVLPERKQSRFLLHWSHVSKQPNIRRDVLPQRLHYRRQKRKT